MTPLLIPSLTLLAVCLLAKLATAARVPLQLDPDYCGNYERVNKCCFCGTEMPLNNHGACRYCWEVDVPQDDMLSGLDRSRL